MTVRIAERNAQPRFYACNVQVRQLAATVKRIIANARHAIRKRDARQAAAIIERIIADARHAVWNRNARQSVATGES